MGEGEAAGVAGAEAFDEAGFDEAGAVDDVLVVGAAVGFGAGAVLVGLGEAGAVVGAGD